MDNHVTQDRTGFNQHVAHSNVSGDYEQLCRLDNILSLEDQPAGDQAAIYEELKKQLIRSDEGWYETGLSWKPRHPQLPNNKMESLE